MILYHGTTAEAARNIMREGWSNKTNNWRVKSKSGYAYLSLAYAPYYSMNACAKAKTTQGAILKIEVSNGKLYPDDDFIMRAAGLPVYTQKQLDRLDLEDYQSLAASSLQYMGNAAAKFKDVMILACREFDVSDLIMKCDPTITPLNFVILGDYYKKLTEHILKTGSYKDYSQMDYFREREQKGGEQYDKSIGRDISRGV